MVLKPVESEPIPVEVDVDSEAIELVADERPVEVEVDSDVRLLLVVLRPVESEPMPVEVDVAVDVEGRLTARRRCCWSCSARSKGR
ncbi:gene 11-1 protein [Burkholderia pseudomallei]|nr:gene 11-1 protein [Burkholderia pseudomallei]